MRSPPRPCRPGARSWSDGRTPSCARRRTRSACRRARWATPRSATSTSAPGGPVLQDLPRIDAAIADGSFFERPAFLAACARARETRWRPAHRHLDRTGRRPRQRPPSRGAGRAGPSTGRPERPGPRVARRSGYAAVVGARVCRRSRAASGRRAPGCPDRERRWALLRDGPRSPLGTGRTRLRRHRPRRGGRTRRVGDRRDRGRLRPGRDRRVRHADGHRGAPGRRSARRRADHPRQFPGGSRPGADPRPHRRACLRRFRPPLAIRPAGADRPAGRDHDRVRSRPAGRRSPSRRRRRDRWPRPSPRPAGSSSTSPRPRSTPTSRISSTAASSRPIPARSGC